MADVVDISSRDPNQHKIVKGLSEAVEGKPARVTTYAVSDGEAVPVAGSGFVDADGSLASMDLDAFFNIRSWLMDAVIAKGAKVTGAGIGMGQADISMEIEGMPYNISIRPVKVSAG